MKIIKLINLSSKDRERIIKRSAGNNQKIIPQVRKIMKNVRIKGDMVLFEYGRKYYGKNYSELKVSKNEIKQAYRVVNRDFINAIKQMIKNISKVHQSQLRNKKDYTIQPEKGIKVWREWRAIEKVGLYIPGGKAIYQF